jgi:hypothetical protein
MEDRLFDLQQRFAATSAGSCSSQVNLVSPMKIAGGVIDGLVKGPYFYFPSRERDRHFSVVSLHG